MPIDTSIYSQLRPPQPVNPFGDLMQVLQFKQAQQLMPLRLQEAQQNAQANALALQEKQMQLQDMQNVREAYSKANNPDGTFNMDNVKAALSRTPGGLKALEGITQFEKGNADLAEAQGKVDLLHRNNGGAIANSVGSLLDKDPVAAAHAFLMMGQNGISNKTINPQTFAPHAQAVQQALDKDPTGQAVKPVLGQIVQMLKQNSPEQQKLENEAKTAEGGLERGQAATNREARENAAQGFTQAVGALATNPPKDAAAYQQAIDSLPHGVATRVLQAVPIDQYDQGKAADAFNKAAMTANERYRAENPAASGGRVPVEQQAVNTAAQVVAKKLGIALDPNKPWQEQIPVERQPSVFLTAKQMTQDPAVRAGVEEARNNARSDKSYQFSVRELDQVGKPIADAVQRLGRLQDTLAQNSPQADALVGPELLTVMAGGAGSGLRMNEAEIARVIGGRSNWESLKAAINKWQLDPSKANSITQDQRNQIHTLVQTVASKVQAKQQIIDQANQELLQSDNPNAHRKAVFNARKSLTSIDEQAGAGATTQSGAILPPQARAQLKEGKHTTFGNGQTWTLQNGQPVQVQGAK